MPSLNNHPGVDVVKMLVVGDSGTGKTGGLASLVDAGYKLRILDFEAKLEPLIGYAKQKTKLADISYITLKDEYKVVGSMMSISKATSFQLALKALNKWEDGEQDLGPVTSWNKSDVLVIDALSSMSRAAMNMVLLANNHFGKPPELQHWGAAMDTIEKVIGNLTNPAIVPCHLVMLTHVTVQESEGGGLVKAYPEALGSKLNPKVGRYFNNLIGLSLQGGEKTYKTKKDGLLACKTSKPIKDRYSLETGMAEMFKDLLS